MVERGGGLNVIFDLVRTPQKQGNQLLLNSCGAVELEILDEAIKSLFPWNGSAPEDLLRKLRTGAVKGNPKDEELGTASFKACLQRKDVEGAQEVSHLQNILFDSPSDYYAVITSLLQNSWRFMADLDPFV